MSTYASILAGSLIYLFLKKGEGRKKERGGEEEKRGREISTWRRNPPPRHAPWQGIDQ